VKNKVDSKRTVKPLAVFFISQVLGANELINIKKTIPFKILNSASSKSFLHFISNVDSLNDMIKIKVEHLTMKRHSRKVKPVNTPVWHS
jgi:hypothetical protein